MSTLHTALQSLSPTSFSSVPTSQPEATAYLQTAFSDAQTIIDSVPLPPPTDPVVPPRPRASTGASVASNVSEISSSSARSEPFHSSHLGLQKEWGKPIKLNAKDNPLGMAVYKVGGKDGRGAWFARRSVHEGLSFRKWKLGLQREFPETLTVQGGPGEGNIRGIGGERRVERIGIDGVGSIEGKASPMEIRENCRANSLAVYHLSAQFPGPTTPRDFVTLLLTTSSAQHGSSSSRPSSPASDGGKAKSSRFADTPEHFMVISRPCEHPDCPPRDGFIRGNYESVEFIREISTKPKKSASTTDLLKHGRAGGHAVEEEALLRNESLPASKTLSPSAAEDSAGEGRARGKTISFAGSRGLSAKGEKVDTPQDDDDDESNPVEWIMITRSDPGGSVPRFMVERGTPGSIVADASKFLDWACKKEHPEDEIEALDKGDIAHMGEKRRESLEPYQTNGRLAGLDGANEMEDTIPSAPTEKAEVNSNADPVQETKSGSLLSSATNAAYAGFEAYAPRAVLDRLPGHQQSSSISASVASIPSGVKSTEQTPSLSSASSVASFASAEDYLEGTQSNMSALSTTKSASAKDKDAMSPHEKELAKLNERKRQLNEKLNKTREKETKDKEELTSKEEERIRKAEEKHAREIAKQEEKYKREVAKLAAKRQKETAKEEDRKKKAEDKDERSRLNREKEEARAELEVVGKERDILRDQVGALQKENTALVARLGKIDEGREVLKEVKMEVQGGNRSSSGSVQKGKELGKEATILGAEKNENL